MILTGKIFKYRYAVNGVVLPPVIVSSPDMTAADNEMILYGERMWREDYPERSAAGRSVEVRILEVTEIDLETL
jgi:hypothetical protein